MRSIARKHGGRVFAESEGAGKGTTVTLELPRNARRRGMSRVLVVEDEAHLAQGLRFNLQAEGHAVEVAGDGETALDRLVEKREHFDAVVLDVMLPGKSGFDVAALLREKKNYVPILMLTARGRPEDVLQGFAAGADDYLPKPFELAILIARLESLLRRSVWMKGRRDRAERRNAGAENADADLDSAKRSSATIRLISAASRLTLRNWNCARWEIRSI